MRNRHSDAHALRARGFTLIEIMVVVVIIGILAAMVGPRIFGNVYKAQVTRAKQDIRNIESALKMYRLDNFSYPGNDEGLSALVQRPNDPNLTNWQEGGYLERLPKDPWNNEYVYLNPGQQGEIDIYSLGRDGRPGGDAEDRDIGNWDLN